MLPDLRFVIGAVFATAVLGLTAFGLTVSLRLAHQAKVGPLEASRSLAYAGQTDWNQFNDPAGVRRFEKLGGAARLPTLLTAPGAADEPRESTGSVTPAAGPAPAAPTGAIEIEDKTKIEDKPAEPQAANPPQVRKAAPKTKRAVRRSVKKARTAKTRKARRPAARRTAPQASQQFFPQTQTTRPNANDPFSFGQ